MLNFVRSLKSEKSGYGIESPRKSMQDMVIDSLVVAGISMFSLLATGSGQYYAGLVAGGLAFFIQLSIERGIKR